MERISENSLPFFLDITNFRVHKKNIKFSIKTSHKRVNTDKLLPTTKIARQKADGERDVRAMSSLSSTLAGGGWCRGPVLSADFPSLSCCYDLITTSSTE